MRHGVHGGIDVDRAPFFHECVIGIHAEEIQTLQTENDGQPDGERLQGLFDLLLFLPAGAATRAPPDELNSLTCDMKSLQYH